MDVGVVGGVGAAVAVTVLCMSAVGIGLCYLKQKKTRAGQHNENAVLLTLLYHYIHRFREEGAPDCD